MFHYVSICESLFVCFWRNTRTLKVKHQSGFFSFCHSRQKHAKLLYVEKAYFTVTKKQKERS